MKRKHYIIIRCSMLLPYATFEKNTAFHGFTFFLLHRTITKWIKFHWVSRKQQLSKRKPVKCLITCSATLILPSRSFALTPKLQWVWDFFILVSMPSKNKTLALAIISAPCGASAKLSPIIERGTWVTKIRSQSFYWFENYLKRTTCHWTRSDRTILASNPVKCDSRKQSWSHMYMGCISL